MKKIFQIGFIATLAVLLPTGALVAGNGDGDGKNNIITVKTVGNPSSITLHITSTALIDLTNIHIKNSGSYIKELNPVLNGVDVIIEMDPETFYSNPDNDGGIIIEIVGVDNITGVDATSGNNGTSIPTGFHAVDENTSTTPTTSSNNGFSAPAGIVQSTSTNSGNINPVFTGSSNRKDVNIFPNPVVDETNIVTVGEILGRTIQIMDLTGHIAMSINIATDENTRQTVLHLGSLTPGIYILMYQTQDGQTISKKIQKI